MISQPIVLPPSILPPSTPIHMFCCNDSSSVNTFGFLLFKLNLFNIGMTKLCTTQCLRSSAKQSYAKVLGGFFILWGEEALSAGPRLLGFRVGMMSATRMLTVMQKAGVEPNLSIFNTAIHVLVMGNMLEKALRFLNRMQIVGITPNVVTYNCIIKGLLRGTSDSRSCGADQ
ncbi:Pentatricopeptide repeat [Dillenia turbinata]|uniref:Pentatricopeptide repeat n=1 Tax=Dillenia turbinata TaxID=194707 RepID=A0AAN8VD60_9MAGN